VDFRQVRANYTGPRIHADVPGRAVDAEWGIHRRWIEHETGGYWDYCDFPLRDADVAAVEAWPMPSPDDYDYAGVLKDCKRHEGYAIYVGGAGLGDIINKTGMIRTMEQVLVDLVTDDPAGLLFIDRRLKIELEVTRRTIEAAKGHVDFVWIGEDLGSQNAPLISLSLFRKHIRPRHQRLVDLAKAHGLPVMIHTCGSSSWAYEDFIEMGINAIDTLQPEAKDMSPAYLKVRFGGRLAFHGCISTRGPVAYGTVPEVVEDVRRTLEIMMPGGGYCLAPTHLLQDNSKTENVVALYEAAHKYGRYS
jgi:uroporphyrinogen decarboxylase